MTTRELADEMIYRCETDASRAHEVSPEMADLRAFEQGRFNEMLAAAGLARVVVAMPRQVTVGDSYRRGA